jgi:pimeloyl-ACP methyl ester carboxylesterase
MTEEKPVRLRRAFVDLPGRQVHLRRGGEGAPLVMLHASPGASAQLVPLAEQLARSRHVIAPDTPGNGDSPALAMASPEIADYVRALVELLDALGLERVDLYGSHTGAAIAVETAILVPQRVGRLVLDGFGLFAPAERDEYLARYAPVLTPDLSGAYLQNAFMFLRDQLVFWPWYGRTAAQVHGGTLPGPAVLHGWLVELLKAVETYPLAYGAAFRYLATERLPLVTHRTLALARPSDPLRPHTQAAAALMPDATYADMTQQHGDPWGSDPAAAILAFLNG